MKVYIRGVVLILCLFLMSSSSTFSLKEEQTEPIIYSTGRHYIKENTDFYYFLFIPKEYREICKQINKELDIPYKIIYNLVLKESRWREGAKNVNATSYDIGLVQINSRNFDYFYWNFNRFIKERKLGIRNTEEQYREYFFNPEINLWTGFSYLKFLINHYRGEVYWALVAYNCGYNKVDSGRAVESSKLYASFILSNTP